MYLIMAIPRSLVKKRGGKTRMGEKVLSGEAAEILGLAVSTVLNLIKSGRLIAEKRNRDWLIDKQSLEAYKKNRRSVGRPAGTVSAKPARNRAGSGEAAEREREYQREYKRQLRAGKLASSKKKR